MWPVTQFLEWGRRLAVGPARIILAASISLAACGAAPGTDGALYEPTLARQVTRAERWQLDLDLMNELVMREHSNGRFGNLEARARWAEDLARWDPVADLAADRGFPTTSPSRASRCLSISLPHSQEL